MFQSGLHKSPHLKAIWRSREQLKIGKSLSEFKKAVLANIRVKGPLLFMWHVPQKLARIYKTNTHGEGEGNPETRQQSCSKQ